METQTPGKSKVQNVLIVEDEKPLCNLLQEALTKAGFTATGVYDGQAALDSLAKNKYDLVLLDMLLPKVDGFGVLAEMSQRHDLTPVIVVSNLGLDESKKGAMDLGAKNYLIKSETTVAEIIKMVRNFN
ncbi:MAG TPA: response regulator [Candidatus Limnocylindria bacterium]|nr:response regulator [Candidatus Limnocylindria bacterium]